MPLDKLKRIIRDSSGLVPPPKPAVPTVQHAFPLVAKSQAMRDLVENCFDQARQGRYVALAGHKDDLLEAPSFFLHLSDRLGLAKRLTVGQGREAMDFKTAVFKGMDSVFVPSARQIPWGVQHTLADERFPVFGLLLFVINIPCQESANGVLCPDLKARCGDALLRWPGWAEREADRQDLVRNACGLLSTGFGQDVTLEQGAIQAYAARHWKTVGHMVKAIHADMVRTAPTNGAIRLMAHVTPSAP